MYGFTKAYKIYQFIILLIIVSTLFVIAGEENASPMTKRISSAGLTGLSKFVVDLYNDNRILLAFLTSLTMSVVGCFFAFATDGILKLFGFKTTKIEHKE